MDIRWEQRFENFNTAFRQLKAAFELAQSKKLSDLEKQGYIQAFEFTHELAWNVLKDFIEYTGGQKLVGSKDTTREAFQKDIISNGDVWMEMIKSRNLTSHTYNESTSREIIEKISKQYVPAFIEFQTKMSGLKKNKK